MIRYAITSRTLFPGDDRQQQAALIRQCDRWVADGIDFIQLREKDLAAAEHGDEECSESENAHEEILS